MRGHFHCASQRELSATQVEIVKTQLCSGVAQTSFCDTCNPIRPLRLLREMKGQKRDGVWRVGGNLFKNHSSVVLDIVVFNIVDYGPVFRKRSLLPPDFLCSDTKNLLPTQCLVCQSFLQNPSFLCSCATRIHPIQWNTMQYVSCLFSAVGGHCGFVKCQFHRTLTSCVA